MHSWHRFRYGVAKREGITGPSDECGSGGKVATCRYWKGSRVHLMSALSDCSDMKIRLVSGFPEVVFPHF